MAQFVGHQTPTPFGIMLDEEKREKKCSLRSCNSTPKREMRCCRRQQIEEEEEARQRVPRPKDLTYTELFWNLRHTKCAVCGRRKTRKTSLFSHRTLFCGKPYFGHSFFPKMPVYLPFSVYVYAVKNPIFASWPAAVTSSSFFCDLSSSRYFQESVS